MILHRTLLCAAILAALATASPRATISQVTGSRTLAIAPIAQQTAVWCWAATAEMVFRHYGLPNLNPVANYQCGVVGAFFGGACAMNCGACITPIGGMAQLNTLIQGHGTVARQVGMPSPVLRTRLQFRALSLAEVKQEVDTNHPVVAGITAGGFPFPNIAQHVVVIVGYDANSTPPTLIVNDPFPYDLPQFVLQGRPNPYTFAGAVQVQPGRYRIAYSVFAGFMAWGNSIDQIR
jgi:hypothetical protein